MHIARRTLLGAVAGSAALGAVAGASPASANAAGTGGTPSGSWGSAAAAALGRLLPRHHQQVVFRTMARKGGADVYRVSGRTGRITVEGTTPAVQLTGFHRYLRHTAHAHFSWNGEQTALPDRLPAPAAPLTGTANAVHRFVLNDTGDGYTGPYRDWAAWEREIDILALHGFNEVLVYAGADAVYHRTFLEHGYDDAELRGWIPGPAHQPWWLLQNMASYGGPVSRELLARRTELSRRIVHRLRELGMTPVLPGWFGTVPPEFDRRNPGARIVPQGDWGGFRRPDWLDPRTPHFARVARTFYRVQEELHGATSMYKMDLLHEGGTPGDVPVAEAARAVEEALQSARPGAVWAILGWQENPRREILDAVDRSKMLVLDGLSDRFPKVTDREADWGGTPYAFGSIWNFGGHTAMGANTPDWAALYDRWRRKPGSALRGIALMPEATGNNPAALALFSDLAWTDGPTDLAAWFGQWSVARYGAADPHAARAWDVLRRTAYGTTRTDSWSEAADGLFGARPDLAVTHAGTWSPRRLRYDATEFEKALPALLAIAPGLRGSSAYRYDLMDVARQCIANRSRLLLPRIKAAHDAGDRARFGDLTRQWLDWMTLLEQVTATDTHHLLGRWTADARAWGATPAERDALEYDAVSLLTIWGPRAAADGGKLHDYANREWSGLIGGLYRLRWTTYFTELSDALAAGRSPKPIDWFALEERWTRERPTFPSSPRGDIVRIARTVASRL
ncbi:alpha-N-acetylglucosaminidase [Streptomyces morookaense]|uniref:Alpha-N-acetylglucosaminidase n=1 Tax=Streptomyces morookaense TaxID=1970 RepID=A0A7Y7B4V1_STRMO|nr:alpha-N-acetylglucosaminidase [Streptomyces morookaense]NVK79069.1 alpha-N-acetylglucosaminidase [Streptomyces morookaense]GHF10113.1 alpha-N-acetylglucosaminidase [Streptomyces morookaense]